MRVSERSLLSWGFATGPWTGPALADLNRAAALGMGEAALRTIANLHFQRWSLQGEVEEAAARVAALAPRRGVAAA